MSFFKKDYSAYPQPVIVTPDPRDSAQDISAAVAEAIDSTHPHSHPHSQTTTDSLPQDTKDQHPDTQQDTSSQQTGTGGDGPDAQQQKDTTTRLADGIMSLLGPVVQEMDFNIVSVRKSQSELEKEIERLMAELQLFLASSASPPEVEPAVQKLIKARRQIMAANSTLKTVQERVDRMHHQIEKQQKK
ncbi:MAG: Snapin/Pallidin-domain-containing protein [Linnemannia elongata]|nr:MAG: Snapin/Pallidin-domain-containing protein [Linnemannia elongata]